MPEAVTLDDQDARRGAMRSLGVADHARLLDDSGLTWVRLRGPRLEREPVRRLRALASGDGLWLLAAEPAQGEFVLAGKPSAFASALLRWPDEPPLATLGERLAQQLSLPLRTLPLAKIGDRRWLWGARTYVMGVLNVTPDSFSDGGAFLDPGRAADQAQAMVAEGADMIDIGGESTRPGADPVDARAERHRIIPVIRRLARSGLDVPISVDTQKAEVAAAAVDAGAQIVNDVGGLRRDPAMPGVVARLGVPAVVMHMQGEPRTMQHDPRYDALIDDILHALGESCRVALEAGVRPENLVVDPGIGFGKSLADNLLVLRRLRAFRALGYPLLVGTSRKSFIGKITGDPPEARVEGTAASVAMAVQGLADIVRVHDVAAMRKVTAVSDAVVRGGVDG